MSESFLTPSDFIRSIRQQRGDEPGPRSDVVLPNTNIAPAIIEEEPAPEAPRVTPVSSEGTASPRPAPVFTRPHVDLASRKGWFDGHDLSLNEAEVGKVSRLLAGIVVRQLSEELKRVAGRTPRRRQAKGA